MIVILLAAAAISGVLAVLENDSFADVIIILAVVLINAVLGVYQESKAEKGHRSAAGHGSSYLEGCAGRGKCPRF